MVTYGSVRIRPSVRNGGESSGENDDENDTGLALVPCTYHMHIVSHQQREEPLCSGL